MNAASDWEPLGSVPPGELVDARLQCHWAAQVIAAIGSNFVEPQPDDSHPNLGSEPSRGSLVGWLTPLNFQGALRLRDLMLLLLDEDGRSIDHYDLNGQTMEKAYLWLTRSIANFTGKEIKEVIEGPGYPLPPHPVAKGEPFASAPKEHFDEVARYFSNAHAVLQDLQLMIPEASEVRCWPHHFDLATLLTIEAGDEPVKGKYIGVGMEPGDEYYAEPYFYVNLSRQPWNPDFPELPANGIWHTDKFFAAILRASDIVTLDASEQRDAVEAFLRAAIRINRRWLADS